MTMKDITTGMNRMTRKAERPRRRRLRSAARASEITIFPVTVPTA
jgi:hypothetical protein